MNYKNTISFFISACLLLCMMSFSDVNLHDKTERTDVKNKKTITVKNDIEKEQAKPIVAKEEVVQPIVEPVEPSRGKDARSDIKEKIIKKIIQRDGEFGCTRSPEIVDDIAEYIVSESEKNEVPPLLIASMIDVESKFRDTTTSSMGASGMMQITTSTSRYISDKMGLLSYDLSDYHDSIKMGVYYYAKECVVAWSSKEIGLKHPKTNKTLDKYQMGLLTYNGGTRCARNLSNIEYLYLVESALQSF